MDANDISFTGSTIAIVTAMLTTVLSGVGMLFRMLIAAKDAAIASLTVELERERQHSRELDHKLDRALMALAKANGAGNALREVVQDGRMPTRSLEDSWEVQP